MMTMRFAITALTVLLAAGTVWAEECPEAVPEDSGQRRAQAKKWFARGEAAGAAGDDVAALKAYQCSSKLVPHGFTAYNIAQIAERMGDIEVAITSYGQYLLLIPDAQDAQEVSQKVETLKERLAKVRQQEKAAREAAALARAGSRAPTNAPAASPGSGWSRAPADVPPWKRVDPVSETTDTKDERSKSYRRWGLITYGGAAVLIVGGVITNVFARSQMDTCRSKYNQQPEPDVVAAESACNAAKPFAYISYGLFGLGAAAAVVGTVLVLRPSGSDEVALVPRLDGGLTLAWTARY